MCLACAADPVAVLVCRDRVPDYLRHLYLLRDCSDRQLEEIAAASRPLELEDGEWLFRQGDPAERFYVVRSGEVALFLLSRAGKESVVALVGADEMFEEELVFLDHAHHGINARAVGPCTLLSLDRRGLRALLLETPELALRLLSTQHRRQRILLEHIQRLTLEDATERLIHYLLEQVGSDDGTKRIRLRVPKQTLASHLSIQPETLSRILQRLKAHHHIAEDGDILLVNARGLRAGLGCEHCGPAFWGCPGPGQLASWLEDQGVEAGRPVSGA